MRNRKAISSMVAGGTGAAAPPRSYVRPGLCKKKTTAAPQARLTNVRRYGRAMRYKFSMHVQPGKKRRELKHRLSVVYVNRKWHVRFDGVQTSHDTIDHAAAQIAFYFWKIEHCACQRGFSCDIGL